MAKHGMKLLLYGALTTALWAVPAGNTWSGDLGRYTPDTVPASVAAGHIDQTAYLDVSLVKNYEYIVLGELHGTREAPQFAGEMVANLVGQGARVLVAIELSAEDNIELQRIWADSRSDILQGLKELKSSRRQDGVGSEAMFSMLNRLHVLYSQGWPIGVVAFNGFRNDEQMQRLQSPNSQAGHERAQAENIIGAYRQGGYDHVVVLVGSTHARIREIEIFGDRFRPMTMELREDGRTVSLGMATSGGSAWNCRLRPNSVLEPGQSISDDMVVCGSVPLTAEMPAQFDSTRIEVPHIGLGHRTGSNGEDAYDGYFWVGEVTASPPALVH